MYSLTFLKAATKAVIDGLVETAKSVPGVTLLDHSSDASHNRSVFTLVGDDQNIQEVAFRLVKYASENIDLTKHQGEHPRMGATDVLPFVPIKDITSEECVEIAKTVSERINRELGIPIFLYEDAATRPERKNLAKVRKGQFEGMPENSWKLTGHLTTVKERFTQLLVLLLSERECRSSPTTSTWIQTIWKLPTTLPKLSVDQAVATSTVKLSA